MTAANAVRASQSGPFTSRRKSATITPGAITTLQTVAVAFPFAEAEVGDTVGCSFRSALVAGIIFSSSAVLVKGTVTLYFANITAGTLTQTIITANVNIEKAAP
jgi:hypothetical protein